MNAYWLDSGIRQFASSSIAGYQKYISPRKGFKCAHRLLYGGESCSGYIKRAIERNGLAIAIEASRQRFEACRQANRILRASIENSESEEGEIPQKPKRNDIQNGDNCLADAGCACCEAGLLSDSLDCSLPSWGSCGSGIDCTGVDGCAALDCGSCSF